MAAVMIAPLGFTLEFAATGFVFSTKNTAHTWLEAPQGNTYGKSWPRFDCFTPPLTSTPTKCL